MIFGTFCLFGDSKCKIQHIGRFEMGDSEVVDSKSFLRKWEIKILGRSERGRFGKKR